MKTEIKGVIPTLIKGTRRANRWLTFIGCLLALSIVWINDLLSACRSTRPTQLGLSSFEAIGMVITVLFFISVLSLFPAAIYAAFEFEGRDHAKKRILDQLKRENLKDILEEQVEVSFDAAYDPSKYRLPVVLVTVAMMLGWAFFFFSGGPDPVWQLASERNLSDFLTSVRSLHPVVFGFLGAFFFSLQTLVHRYFTADLKASVFMHIAVRIWLVMLLSLVLSIIWQAVPVPDGSASMSGAASSLPQSDTLVSSPWLLVVCFITGIVPDVALDLIWKTAKAVTGKIPFASDIDPPMTRIQGLNLWHQVRLAEEGIDNIQNLAESDIGDLIAYTRLGVRRLLDWIDQALLYIHTGDDFARYQEAGMHTATEFVSVYEARLERKQSAQGGIQHLPPTSRMFNQWVAVKGDVNFQRLVKWQNAVGGVVVQPS